MQTIALGMDLQWDPAVWLWELCLDTYSTTEQRVEKRKKKEIHFSGHI